MSVVTNLSTTSPPVQWREPSPETDINILAKYSPSIVRFSFTLSLCKLLPVCFWFLEFCYLGFALWFWFWFWFWLLRWFLTPCLFS